MAAVREHGDPLVDDPDRVGQVRALGVDETSWLAANSAHATLYATGLVDLEARVVIDVIPGNRGTDLGSWLDRRTAGWLAGVEVVATDLTESYRSGLEGRLDQAIRVADPFHVVRAANRCLDQVRRRVQNRTLGHRGRKRDPLYRIRKLMLKGAERLEGPAVNRLLLGIRAGDPEDDVLGAWLAKESVRDVYLSDDAEDAALLLDKAIAGCQADRCPKSADSGGRSPAGGPRSSTTIGLRPGTRRLPSTPSRAEVFVQRPTADSSGCPVPPRSAASRLRWLPRPCASVGHRGGSRRATSTDPERSDRIRA
jgi:hypothetical protein